MAPFKSAVTRTAPTEMTPAGRTPTPAAGRRVLIIGAAVLALTLLASCATVADMRPYPERTERFAVHVGGGSPGAGHAGAAEPGPVDPGAATEAEITVQCLLPVAVANAETIHAPTEELAAFMQSVATIATPSEMRPDLVSEVDAGRRTVANAAWWGFDPEDATDALQAALDSPAQAVVVPDMGSPWIIQPVFLRSNLVLVLEDGAEILAKSMAFTGRNDRLLEVENAENIIVWGYGATLRMRKEEYSSAPYAEAEWRHALSFESVSNIGVYGIHTDNSGGDGIYLGRDNREKPYCENVVIRDVLSTDNNRQGMSIVSAKDVIVESSVFANTQGTLPQAGIDFEPDQPWERLENIVVRDSVFFRNRGAGVQFFLWNMTEESVPVSVRIENSTFRGNTIGLLIARAGGNPTGRVVFENSDVGWPRWVSTPPGFEVVYE